MGENIGGRVRMNIVIVGHVDHGKSTVVGRLLADTGSLPEGKLEAIREYCRRNSKPFEYAFLLDALKDEQAQGITIDTARTFFKSSKRDYIIIDAPGHIEFLKNMVTGAARAEAAVLVIDAKEGVRENSKRHGYLLSMLGIRQVVVAVNKMDLVDYSRAAFEDIRDEYVAFLARIGATPRFFLPLSAYNGENLIVRSDKMPWYKGPDLLSAVDALEKEPSKSDQPFRMPVQDVYKFTAVGDDRRIVSGRVESGSLRVGDEVVFLPSGKKSRVRSIEGFHSAPAASVGAGRSTGFTLTEQIYVGRGELMAKAWGPPPSVGKLLRVNLFWMGKRPFEAGRNYFLKLGTVKIPARLLKINYLIDASETQSGQVKDSVEKHDVADCVIELSRPLAFDPIDRIEATGRFVIVDEYEIAGGGIIREAMAEAAENGGLGAPADGNANVVWHRAAVSREDRARVSGQRGAVLWFTGLSGSGKSTLANAVEVRLNQAGKLSYLLDGDNVRLGLNADLGFSEHDRRENNRRVSQVAKLLWDANVVTLVSFISPFREEREAARKLVGEDFIEIFVDTPLGVCEERDPKGLYSKARKGQIAEFTGISSPYEIPEGPEITLHTDKESVEECVDKIMEFLGERKYL